MTGLQRRFAAALALCAGVASPAMAHAFLDTALPAVGSTVHQAPSQVVITFTQGIEPLFTTVAVTDAHGARVDTGSVHLAGDNTHAAIALKPLGTGTYKVVWHATSVDTHKTQGSFSFTVAPE
jgi:methionine-rich copper-binding protein CopC